MTELEKRIFIKGINKDSDVRLLDPTEYRGGRNIRSTDNISGSKFSVQNLKGTEEQDLGSITLGTQANKIIGYYDDKINGNLYYFIWNSTNDDIVLKKDYNQNGDITEVIRGDLGFSPVNIITGVALIDNRFLVWTDNLNEPCMVDLGNLSKYPTITEDNRYYIELAKPNSPTPPSGEYGSDLTYTKNNLTGYLYKFATRFIYNDYTESAVSSVGRVSLPKSLYNQWADSPLPNTTDNKIVLQVPKGNEDVKTVQVLMKYGGTDDTMSDWYIIKSIDTANPDVGDSVVYTDYFEYEWINNTPKIQLDTLKGALEQTYIPRQALALENTTDNKLVIGNFIDNFDVEDVNITMSPIYHNKPSLTTSTPKLNTPTVGSKSSTTGVKTNTNFFIEIGSPNNINRTPITITSATPIQARDIAIINFDVNNTLNTSTSPPITTVKSVSISYTVTQADRNVNDIASSIANAINQVDSRSGGIGGIVAEASGNIVYIYDGQEASAIVSSGNYEESWAYNFTTSVDSEGYIGVYQSLARRTSQSFGIEYRDGKGRRSSVLSSSGSNQVYIKDYDEVTFSTQGGYVTPQISISSTAPNWAETAHIMWTKRQDVGYFLEFKCEVVSISSNRWTVDLSNLDSFNDEREDSVLSYSYVDGDMVHILFTKSGTLIKEFIDAKIIEYATDTGLLTVEFNGASTTPPISSGVSYIVRIFRPQPTEEVWYETGYTLPLSSGGLHLLPEGLPSDESSLLPSTASVSASQTSTSPFILNMLDVGDCYYKQRVWLGSGADVFFIQDPNASDFYSSDVHSIGRVGVESDSFREVRRDTAIVNTESYIPDSEINGLSTVFSSSIIEGANRFGSIQRLYQDTKQMVIFQENKVGLMGISQESQIDSGNFLTYQTNSTLNNIYYYNQNFGIGRNPESFAVFDNRKYFIDPIRECLIRLSTDGMTELSNNRMDSFLKPILNIIPKTQQLPIISGVYDNNSSEYIFSINEKAWIEGVNILSSTIGDVELRIQKSEKDSWVVGDEVTLYYIYNSGAGRGNQTVIVKTATENTDTWDLEFDLNPALGEQPTTMEFVNYDNFVACASFSEDLQPNGFVSDSLDYTPDIFVEMGSDVGSGKSGVLWKHNVTENRNLIYGEQYNSEIEIWFNQNPSQPKQPLNIQIESNDVWVAETDGDIETLESQKSQLYEAYFSKRNNQWFAAFRRDTTTPNRKNPLVEGYPLTSGATKVKLTNDNTEQVVLFSVGVSYISKNLSNNKDS